MSKAYENRRNSHKPEMGLNKEDTKYVYIPMKELIDYVDLYKNAKGVKAYFGVIDDHKIKSDPKYKCKPEHKKQTTIILKATYDLSLVEPDVLPLIAVQQADGEPLDDFGLCPPSQVNCSEIY